MQTKLQYALIRASTIINFKKWLISGYMLKREIYLMI